MKEIWKISIKRKERGVNWSSNQVLWYCKEISYIWF